PPPPRAPPDSRPNRPPRHPTGGRSPRHNSKHSRSPRNRPNLPLHNKTLAFPSTHDIPITIACYNHIICGRYTLRRASLVYAALGATPYLPSFEEFDEKRVVPRFNIAPSQTAPIVRINNEGHRVVSN